MKIIYLAIALMAAINVSLYSTASNNNQISNVSNKEITEVEALDIDEHCIAGGEGAASCELSGDVGVRADVGGGCKVECRIGYYACCSLFGCHCVRESDNTWE